MTRASADEKTELLGLAHDEVSEFMVALGEKPYRARQLYDERGQVEGQELEDWVRAESEVLKSSILAPLWNVAGEPDAYTDAAGALGCRVDEVPAMFATLCNASGMAAAMVSLDATMVAEDVAATMNAVENQPMLHNNARPVTETERNVLAERTVEMWHLLRS